jgi:hypothetical protein
VKNERSASSDQAKTKARLEAALGRLDRAADRLGQRRAKEAGREERIGALRGRIDAAIAAIDRLLGA